MQLSLHLPLPCPLCQSIWRKMVKRLASFPHRIDVAPQPRFQLWLTRSPQNPGSNTSEVVFRTNTRFCMVIHGSNRPMLTRCTHRSIGFGPKVRSRASSCKPVPVIIAIAERRPNIADAYDRKDRYFYSANHRLLNEKRCDNSGRWGSTPGDSPHRALWCAVY